jgi:transcriptional regulator with XRE-family HTH domain
MDIRKEFGLRVKELRARSGMSQEMLAFRAKMDRTYLSGIERGTRNVSLVNIEQIARGLNVTLGYFFSNERFSVTPAYKPKDFAVPFLDRFKFTIDANKRILAFQVNGLLTAKDVDYMNSTLMGVCSNFKKGELQVLVDHREMKASDGLPVVYSPDVAERAVAFQQNLLRYSKQAVVLCNSEFMVHQLDHVTSESGIPSLHLFGKDKEMVAEAYDLFGIHDHDLIKTMN